MRITKYLGAAMAVIALSACTVHDGAQSPPVAQIVPKLNTFEVFFDPDRADIGETAARIVRVAADAAKQDNVKGIRLTIHSTAAGWDSDSQALSERRADAVEAALVDNGVSQAKITRVDVPRTQLVAPADGIREPQNRRTEIILY